MKIHDHALLRKWNFLLIVVALLMACSKPKHTAPRIVAVRAPVTGADLRQARWVLGQWQRTTAKGVLSEFWRVKNDSTYAGRSYFMVGTDTVSLETIELGVRGGKLRYIPTVKNQNNGQPVTFTEKKVTGTEMVFENLEHDFPQRIIYTHAGDSLIAVISGVTDGHEKSIRFAMKRIKY